ncbi:MAG TPA: hypothetical protein PK762_03250 [Candidatus Kapabacteria bacterium]|nr:hypothetical protein [Candidatus Kapabacteria bacterium]
METKNKKSRIIFKISISSVLTGFVMWVVGGLYHNLIMPAIDDQLHPHHEGLAIVLIAYILLGLLMSYFYINHKDNRNSLMKGIKIGVIIGILWVFPHGLTMTATHETSFLYQFSNTFYHIIEQGIGGMMIFITFKYIFKNE